MKDERTEGERAAEADEKREQFLRSLARGEVADPISAVVAFIGVKALIAAGVSAAVSLGAARLTRSLPPRERANDEG